MSALRSVSTDSSRLPPVAEELEEPPVQMQNVNEKRRDHQQSHKHHHHHKNHQRSSGGNTDTEKSPTHLNGSPAVSFQNNAVIIPVLHPNHMAAHRPQPTHIVHGSLRTPPCVIREQYWVYSCRPFRCSNWSRCERIMIVLLISLGTLITVLVVLYIASTKPPPPQGQ